MTPSVPSSALPSSVPEPSMADPCRGNALVYPVLPWAELTTDILIEEDTWRQLTNLLGDQSFCQGVAAAVLAHEGLGGCPVDVSLRFVSDAESHKLNLSFRGKDKPTNILSFPAQDPEDTEEAAAFSRSTGMPLLLGDMVFAAGVLAEEATGQNKSFTHHLTHLMVHGLLHLLGWDHMSDEDADRMEQQERDILQALRVPDPYQEQDVLCSGKTKPLSENGDTR